ncbi:hypothetical protein DFH06DRAFT_1172921 [Mycena polygramma]|nr:hypothetical protein DFH06DRAFT_1172921 [Mycena polygramma]
MIPIDGWYIYCVVHPFPSNSPTMLSSSTAVIHSLPTETLSDVFRLVAAVTPEFGRRPPSPSPETELARLANVPLLTLSRVCSRWHAIAINTPSLWSNIEINGMPRGRTRCTRSALERTLRLLSVRLERSREAPLSISLKCRDSEPAHTHIFQLLAQHSHRWETVRIGCSLKGIDTSVLKGRLPRLKELIFETPPEMVDFLEIVPRMEVLVGIPAPLLHSESFSSFLGRKPLRLVSCQLTVCREFQAAISLLPKLPVAAEFYLTINRDRRFFQPHWNIPLLLPSASAPISILLCAVIEEFHPHHLTSALSQIFASLTVRSLRKMVLVCGVYPQLVVEWPHIEFLALCERSDLGRCLNILQVAEVRFAERELIDILSVLPALEHLEVGDTPGNAGEGESTLITDSFLRAMTSARAQEDCLVPRLSYLACVSRLAFTPSFLVDFITARLARLSEAGSPIIFHVCIHPLPGSDPSLNSTLCTGLREIAIRHRQFVYQSGEGYTPQFHRW